MTCGYTLLLRVIVEPTLLAGLTDAEWERLLVEADGARLTGRLLLECDRRGVPSDPAPWLQDRLVTARAAANESERAIRWEIGRIARAFHGLDGRWVLLKGAAYVAARLPPARGRLVADLDVLVAPETLEDAEAALREGGWEQGPLDAYDERYYREWMHEIPPMAHADRGSVVDLHHAILPRTSRLAPDTALLLEQSESSGRGWVLSPTHMVLHAAVHLFHDGEVSGAVRDLVDLDGLLRHFGEREGFWDHLTRDAEALGVTRPAYYAIRYARRVLRTPLPDAVTHRVDGWGPPVLVRALMDALVGASIGGRSDLWARMSAYALYVRSHWLRMPPLMLVRHLTHKALARWRPAQAS